MKAGEYVDIGRLRFTRKENPSFPQWALIGFTIVFSFLITFILLNWGKMHW